MDGNPSLFNNVPLEIIFKDAGWNETAKTINVSGQNTIATVAIPINPVFAGVDLNEKISDAITSDKKVIKATGTSFGTTANGRMQISVLSLTPGDSAFILIEHNWAAPDSFKTPNSNYKISPYHYWKVSGILPNIFDATATVKYDGTLSTSGGSGYLDHQLITATNQEDSIALMYRKDASDDWALFPYYTKTMGNLTDKNGTLKIDSLLLGEYTIAFLKNGSSGIQENENENSIVVYPNPSNGQFTVRSSEFRIQSLEIYNTLGEIIYQKTLNSKLGTLNLNLPSAIYFLHVKTPVGVAVKKMVIQ